MKKWKAILFDFYMTLVDVHTDERDPRVWETLASYLRYWGVTVRPDRLSELYFETVQRDLESSHEQFPDICIRDVFRQMLTELNGTDTDQLVPHLARLMRGLTVRKLEVFPGTLPTLDALRDSFQLALVSDAQKDFIYPEIELTGLSSYWATIVISSDFGYRKPDPRTIETALKRLDVLPGEAIYVGDNVYHDVAGAQNADVYSVLIDRHDQLSKLKSEVVPDRVFDNLNALRGWLIAH